MTPGSILIIDDDQGTCETVGDILQLRGHQVSTAMRGRAGLERLAVQPIDAAIIDLKLPDIPGLALLDAIKQTAPSVEVILITGYASIATAVEAVNGSAFAYLVKPFEMDQLVATVDKALEKQRLGRALRDSEERYRLVTENIMDAVFLLDVEGRSIFGNPRGLTLTGYCMEELQARPLFTVFAPDGARLARARMDSPHAAGWALPFFETQLVRKDGTAIWVEANLATIVKDGDVVGHLAVVRDVTERKLLEDRLRQAQKIEAVGRLAGGVAHDFNNLLTVIGGRCEFLLGRLGPRDALRADVELIARTADRAAALTSQLLAFSRRQMIRPKVLDLNATVRGVQPLLRRLIGEDIEVALDLAEECGHVKADPGQVEQVIMNLAVNARDAMPQGGRLTIATRNVEVDEAEAARYEEVAPGRCVMLAVADTGVGMSAETQTHLFEPFFTTKGVGEGTGLGLAMVYGIVKQSGGHIAVDSVVGQGSTFRIVFPRVDAPVEEEEGARPVALPRRGSETVLLVEDEEAVRDLVREVLAMQGYRVLEAATAAEALAIGEKHDGVIHLLVSDVVMPGMSGKELAERLAADRPGLRVLYMSGYTDTAIVHHGVLAPGTAFLQKPFTPAVLARRVGEILHASPASPPRDDG
jgi:PAS domain S-box-containing protein